MSDTEQLLKWRVFLVEFKPHEEEKSSYSLSLEVFGCMPSANPGHWLSVPGIKSARQTKLRFFFYCLSSLSVLHSPYTQRDIPYKAVIRSYYCS